MAKYDLIIIGGGVIGGSIAFHMSRNGHKVLLLERDRIVSGASSAAAGMLGAQTEMEDGSPLAPIARYSRSRFPKLAEELKELSGIDIGLVQRGLLKVARTPEEVAGSHQSIAFQQGAGQQAEWLTPSQAQAIEPALSDRILGAMYIPEDGQVSAPELSAAYIKASAVLGAEIREYTEVRSLLIEKGKVRGIVAHSETIYCDQVLVAAGVWGNSLAAQAGLSLQVYPVKGECFSVVTSKPLLRTTVFSHGCYLVPKRGGRTVVGATMIAHSYDRTVSVEGLSTLMGRARELIPAIAASPWESCWSGLRPQTPDGLPYLGEAPHVQGLFVAMGHYRNGILLSAVTGELMTDLLEGKKPQKFDLFPFAPDRHAVHAMK